jgi:hypothetical protein
MHAATIAAGGDFSISILLPGDAASGPPPPAPAPRARRGGGWGGGGGSVIGPPALMDDGASVGGASYATARATGSATPWWLTAPGGVG